MKPYLVVIFFCVIAQTIGYEKADYEYDDNAVHEIKSDQGMRLVGASRAQTSNYPFLVGYSTLPKNKKDFTSCTGSLITKEWVVSAAHCILALVDTKNLTKCVEQTANGTVHVNRKGHEMKCEQCNNGDFKIFPVKQPLAYLGVDDVNKKVDLEKGEKIPIEYFIRHKNSYRGGGTYGEFGGIDITLVRLSKPSQKEVACLPSEDFKDSGIGPGFDNSENVMLAGFGKYYREPCKTDDLGPANDLYCAEVPCEKEENPPQEPACSKFFTKNPDKLSDFDNKNLTKITLISSNKNETFCYRNKSILEGSKGWCRVIDDASTMGELTTTDTWGFCSRECFLNETKQIEPDANVLREVRNVDVLDDKLCNEFLESSLYGSVIKIQPEILCIGYQKSQEEKTYTISDNNKIEKTDTAKKSYVTSAGTCNGDSGGPVFVKDKKSGKFIVLGAVSGGRGVLGKCGGLNNPTHYARLKKLSSWIMSAVGDSTKDLCWSGEPPSREKHADESTTTSPV